MPPPTIRYLYERTSSLLLSVAVEVQHDRAGRIAVEAVAGLTARGAGELGPHRPVDRGRLGVRDHEWSQWTGRSRDRHALAGSILHRGLKAEAAEDLAGALGSRAWVVGRRLVGRQVPRELHPGPLALG